MVTSLSVYRCELLCKKLAEFSLTADDSTNYSAAMIASPISLVLTSFSPGFSW